MASNKLESQSCTVRPARSLDEARKIWWPLVQTLGWNRSYEDANTYYLSAGASAWLVLIPPSVDTPRGCILPFVYANRTGWVGFFCIDEDFRGKGYGRQLFQACMDHFTLHSTRFIGLDAVTQQKDTYMRRGFVEKGTIRLMTRRSLQETPLPKSDFACHSMVRDTESALVDISNLPPAKLFQSDLECSGLARERLWTSEALLERGDLFGYGIISKDDNAELQGWIIVRRCTLGFRFGPLYAETVEIAAKLLEACLKRCDGNGSMIAEIWMGNKESLGLFMKHGWVPTGIDYHRMWLDGRVPAEQCEGGKAEKAMFAIFDAGEG